MVLPDEEQRRWKERVVVDALQRIGGLSDVRVDPVAPSPAVLAYRGKVEFTLGRTADGRRAIGLHAAGSPGELVGVERCAVQSDAANAVLAELWRLLCRPDSKIGRPAPGWERYRWVVRTSSFDGGVLVALRGPDGRIRGLADLALELRRARPEVRGVVRIVASPGRRGGSRTLPIAGSDHLIEVLGGTRFRVPAASFFQINPAAAAVVVREVVRATGEVSPAGAVDLYGGVGVHGWAMAGRAGRVTVCEADPEAVRCGRAAVPDRDVRPPEFVRSSVVRFLREAASTGRRADVVVANPPRGGFEDGVASGLAALRPARIVVVSCNPATLARDVAALVGAGYRPVRIRPVDLFPHTPHVETVCVLDRAG